MSDYKTLIGKSIKYLSSDPTDAGAEGQVWYNSTSGAFKTVLVTGAWSSGAPLAQPRARNQGAGTQTAGLTFGGKNGSVYNNTEEYNGSGWTTGGTLPSTVFDHAGDGVQTSAFSAGGIQTDPGTDTNASAEYDGTSWTAGGNLNTARKKLMGLGSSNTAGLVFGGEGAPNLTLSEEYNGTAWTEGNNLNTGRAKGAGSGTQTAGLGFGGYVPGPSARLAATETYDGTSWSSVNNLNTGRSAAAGFGTQTSSLTAGGYDGTSRITTTETWDGTNWSTSPATLATPTDNFSGSGTSSAGWVAGGYTPSVTGATEEYNFSASVITAAAWSSANSQSVPSYSRSGWGTANAGWLAGGGFPSAKTDTEEYDGTNWTSGGTLNTARGSASVGGSQTAAIFASGSRNSAVELYDGSTWTSTTAIPTVRSAAGGGGTQTSLVVFGGSVAGAPTFPISTAVEEWNGSAWTAGTSLPSVRGSMNGSAFGTSSDDAFSAGGVTASPPGAIPHSVTSETLSYNGTTWTEEADILTARAAVYAFGTSGSAIIGGGDTNNSGAVSVLSEQWNGTSWSTNPSIATARYTGGRAGTSSSGWIGGGYPGGAPSSNATEEFNPETTALNYKTITTS
jgi:hypothetical protein